MRKTPYRAATGLCLSVYAPIPNALQRQLYLIFLLPALFSTLTGLAQNTNDYRSAATGSWNTLTTWQRWDGDSWETPTAGEGTPDRFVEAITIRSPHIVSVTATVIVDQVVVETGARVNVNNGNWRIYDGTGTDLTVNGTVEITATLNSSMGPQVVVNGKVINHNILSITGPGSSLSFAAGSTYEHARNGGSVAGATWDPTSSCLISGTLDNNPGGLGQAFGNFIWNTAGMSGNQNFGANGMSIAGNFEVISTGTGRIQYTQALLPIGGNYTQSNGGVRISTGTANRVFEIAGNFDLNGGTLLMTDGSASGTIRVAGDFAHTGSAVTQTGAGGTGNIIFNGMSPQTYSGGTMTTLLGTIDYTVNSGATLTGSGTLGNSSSTTTNNGTIAPGASPGTLSINGDLISSGTLKMEIESLGSFDQLIVSGNADITGTLEVDFGDFVPAANDMFLLIDAGSYSANAPTLTIIDNDNIITAIYDHTTGIVTVLTALPIRLVAFSGKQTGKVIALNWRTESEQNNEYMAVERADHSLQFQEIGRVSGAGTTTEVQDYNFTDAFPLPGANYYRLRQVDTDGSRHYHQVIYVDFIERSVSNTLKVYPNPAAEHIRAAWAAGREGPAELRLFNSSGQLLATHRTDGQNGTYEIPLYQLTAGIYVLHLTQGKKQEVIRFVKQ